MRNYLGLLFFKEEEQENPHRSEILDSLIRIILSNFDFSKFPNGCDLQNFYTDLALRNIRRVDVRNSENMNNCLRILESITSQNK